MKVFVTGGSGQVGSTVIDLLLRAATRCWRSRISRPAGATISLLHDRLTLIEGTIADGALR